VTGSIQFDRFRLDPQNRQLSRDGVPVDLNARYLDALTLLVREPGRLVSKDRFLEEVWRGVPVTDEALTQCIKTLRRQLGDEAARPRFIETVPKHGYRFIAPTHDEGEQLGASVAAQAHPWTEPTMMAIGGTLGGALAGLIGGLFYGFAGAYQPLAPGMGAISVLLVLVCLTVGLATLGAAGVSLGIAATRFAIGRQTAWIIAGGAVGGLVVGTVVKLIGLDAFNLLFGRSPGDITGPFEGILLGAAVGLGAWLARRTQSLRIATAAGGLCGATVGAIIPLIGGHLMGGSLALLATHFPGSRLPLDRIGALFGETGFGRASETVTAGFEGMLFSACVAAGMVLAARRARVEIL